MAAISGSPSSDRTSLGHFHVKRWQLALILVSAAVLALILMAIFVIPTVRIITYRVGDYTEAIQNPATRAEFVPISPTLVEVDRGLREALLCADSRYEVLVNSLGAYSTGVQSSCDMKISWYDFELIKREIPPSKDEGNFYLIEHDSRYYIMVMLYA